MAEPEPYRVLVTGSRNWDSPERVAYQLGLVVGTSGRVLAPSTVVIVHGACPTGADEMAARIARDYGYRSEPHPAGWGRYGKAAGFRRNAEMVSLGAGLCLAFIMPCTDAKCRREEPHGSHGAAHCAGLAEKAGIETRRFYATAPTPRTGQIGTT
jgi:hypothetical protein